MRALYTSQFDMESGLWQILSRSGHVVYESTDGVYVRSVCQELCQCTVKHQPMESEAAPAGSRSCYA